MDTNLLTTRKFEDSFFLAEERDGYLVSEKQKKIWAVQIDLLEQLLNVCKKHGIKITVFAGTILGAIRHKGMIPWDDDIDVALTREEYNKLLKVAPEEFKGQYFFQTGLTDREYFLGYARLRNSETTGLILENLSPDYNNGIYIDIFALDGCPDELKKRTKLYKDRVFVERFFPLYKSRIKKASPLRKFIGKIITATVCRAIPYEKMAGKYDKVLTRYNAGAKNIAMMTHSVDFMGKYRCAAADLDNLINVPFEMIEVPIPANYDSILKAMYGDYMKFPPVEKRGAWHEGQLQFDPDTPYREYISRMQK